MMSSDLFQLYVAINCIRVCVWAWHVAYVRLYLQQPEMFIRFRAGPVNAE